MINVSCGGCEGTGTQSETIGLSETACLYSYHGHTHTSLSLTPSLSAHTYSLSSLLNNLHYREDGEDYLQFSNLYDSALFNQRPMFPSQSNTREDTHSHVRALRSVCEEAAHLIYDILPPFHLLLLLIFMADRA